MQVIPVATVHITVSTNILSIYIKRNTNKIKIKKQYKKVNQE